MSSPYGPSGGQDPQQPWGQQPYGGGQVPGTPSGGFPAQGYPQQQPYPGQQQYPGYGQQPQQPQPTQQYPAGGFQPYGDQQQQQQYPGYGQQQYPGQAPQQQKKKSGGLIWVIVAILVLAVGAVLVLGFVTPGWFTKRVFDHNAVQDGVKQVLVNDYQADAAKIESVTCPEGEQVTKDHRFTCQVKYDGQDFQVDITVRDESTGQYEVANPNLPG